MKAILVIPAICLLAVASWRFAKPDGDRLTGRDVPERSTSSERHRYRVEMTGVVCLSCAQHVKQAFQMLPDFGDFSMEQGAVPGTQRVGFTSSVASLSTDALAAALGKGAKLYVVRSVERENAGHR